MIILYVLLAIIVLLAILSYVMPNSYKIEKVITIDATPEKVYSNVANFSSYNQWNAWQQGDPTAKNVITGTPCTVGHHYSWDGKKVGVGSLTLKSTVENKSVEFDLQFVKPMQSTAYDNWTFTAKGSNQCNVTWTNGGMLPNPVMKVLSPLFRPMLNKQFDKGLSNLKAICESN